MWKNTSFHTTNNPSEGVCGQFNLIFPLSPNNKIKQVNKASKNQAWTRLEPQEFQKMRSSIFTLFKMSDRNKSTL